MNPLFLLSSQTRRDVSSSPSSPTEVSSSNKTSVRLPPLLGASCRASAKHFFPRQASGLPSTPARLCRLAMPRTPFTDHPTLFAKRASDHSPNPSPISGKGLNRSSCRSYIKVPSDHQRSGVILTSPLSPPLGKGLNTKCWES